MPLKVIYNGPLNTAGAEHIETQRTITALVFSLLNISYYYIITHYVLYYDGGAFGKYAQREKKML